MRKITGHTMRSVPVRDDQGNETTKQVVHSVDYIDHQGSVHGLVFHPHGTDVSGDAESSPRVVGVDVPYFEFETPEAAVVAYEHGEIE